MSKQENFGLMKPSLLSFRSRGIGPSIPSRISLANSEPSQQQSNYKFLYAVANKSGSSCERPLELPSRSIHSRLTHPPKGSTSSRLRPTSLIKKPTVVTAAKPNAEPIAPRFSQLTRANKPRLTASLPATPLQSSGDYSFLSEVYNKPKSGYGEQPHARFAPETVSCGSDRIQSSSSSRRGSAPKKLIKFNFEESKKPVENMSIDNLLRLERRLHQLVESMHNSLEQSLSRSNSTSEKFKNDGRYHGRTGSRHSNDTAMSLSALSSSSSYDFKGHSPSRHALPLPTPYTAAPLLHLLESGDLLDLNTPATSNCDREYSSNLLEEFSREELCYLLQAVRNMLALQSLPTPSSGTTAQRPLSWYLPASSSPTPSSTNLFLNNFNVEEDPHPQIGLRCRPRQPQQVDDDQPLAPVLPAGFRNFSRYLDTKFGPDSSSVSLENIDDHKESQQEYCKMQPTYENLAVGDNMRPKATFHYQTQSKGKNNENAFSSESSCYYSDMGESVGESVCKPPALLPHTARASSEMRAQRASPTVVLASTADTSVVQKRQRLSERQARTGPSSPNASFNSPPNSLQINSDEALSWPSGNYYHQQAHDIPSSPQMPRHYWPAQHVLQPYPWYTMHAQPPPLPYPYFGFGDYFGGIEGWYSSGTSAPGGFYQPPPLPMSRVSHVFHPSYQTPNAASWFRAAASHFATAAAMFNDKEVSQFPPIPPVRSPTSQPYPSRSAYSRPDSNGQGSRQFSDLNLPTQMITSAPTISTNRPCPPQFAFNDELVSPDDPKFSIQTATNRIRSPAQWHQPDCPLSSRESPSRLSPSSEPQFEGHHFTDAMLPTCDRSYEEFELPQDPALILPDQMEFYSQIQDLLDLDTNITLPLPKGWSVGISKSGRRFFICDRIRTTTWQHPVVGPRVPLCWERVEMRRNCVYYRHLLIPHAQRHHPDLWFPTTLKNSDFERQNWFFDLRKLQDSVSNFDKGKSQLIEDYVDNMDTSDDARFPAVFMNLKLAELNNLLQHLDCRFFRDLHRIVVAYEVARIRIVRQLLVKHAASNSA